MWATVRENTGGKNTTTNIRTEQQITTKSQVSAPSLREVASPSNTHTHTHTGKQNTGRSN